MDSHPYILGAGDHRDWMGRPESRPPLPPIRLPGNCIIHIGFKSVLHSVASFLAFVFRFAKKMMFTDSLPSGLENYL